LRAQDRPQQNPLPMDDRELTRYSRHILLPQIDLAGQQKLRAGTALLIGAGGLGSPAALYLAASGVGRLIICDGDAVDLTNLQRQVIHRESGIGMNKAESARRALSEVNSGCRVEAVPQRVERGDLMQLARDVDVVVDASDNLPTRHAANAVCVALRKPLVSGAAIRFSGQVAVFDRRQAGASCYECLVPADSEAGDDPCGVMGVFAPLTGVIGALQAGEALRLLAGLASPLAGHLLLFDMLSMDWYRVPVPRNPRCPVCGTA
jgi:molybdopterin/thiamine biosynthesis adenylyltransferase